MAAYGARIPGVSVFAVIPEGTAKVAVEFDAVPEWAQLCDKSWTDKEFPSEASNEGKTVTYTITPEFVTAVATDKEFIINGGGANVVKVYYPSEGDDSGIAGIAAEKKIVNVYDLAGRVVRQESAGEVISHISNHKGRVASPTRPFIFYQNCPQNALQLR